MASNDDEEEQSGSTNSDAIDPHWIDNQTTCDTCYKLNLGLFPLKLSPLVLNG